MSHTVLTIIFYLLLIDSVAATIAAWVKDGKFWKKKFRLFSRYFPITKGWTALYLVLTLFIGYLIHNFATPLF